MLSQSAFTSVSQIAKFYKEWEWCHVKRIGDSGASERCLLLMAQGYIVTPDLLLKDFAYDNGDVLRDCEIGEVKEVDLLWYVKDPRSKMPLNGPLRTPIDLGFPVPGWEPLPSWSVDITLPAIYGATAPMEVLRKMQQGWQDGSWKNLSGRAQQTVRRIDHYEATQVAISRVCDSTKYRFGEEVRPTRNGGLSKSKHRYWMVTTYRSPGDMGCYRLYREDGKYASTSNVVSKVRDESEDPAVYNERIQLLVWETMKHPNLINATNLIPGLYYHPMTDEFVGPEKLLSMMKVPNPATTHQSSPEERTEG